MFFWEKNEIDVLYITLGMPAFESSIFTEL